jgi:ethanolamine utilization cobalamin adenosyltransferase
MEVTTMTDPIENEPTQQLPAPAIDVRLNSIEATLTQMNTKLDVLTQLQREMLKMQQDMYVNLRGRIVSLSGEVLQIQKDMQPDSLQTRLMRMGQ